MVLVLESEVESEIEKLDAEETYLLMCEVRADETDRSYLSARIEGVRK